MIWQNMKCHYLSFGLLTTWVLAAHGAEPDFALRDGDTLAFLGDSITAARGYTKIVEHYTLMRFPDRRVHFFNAGQGGDTAYGAVSRLERDVFSKGATVVTVAFGVNDIGWGARATPENRRRYLEGVSNIVAQCQVRKIRVFICSPAITSEPPDKAETGFLQTMTDEGMALAKTMGAGTIDLQRGMRAVHRRVVEADAKETDPKKQTRLHVEDGVHLNDLGQLAMAHAMLKGLGAPTNVSAVAIDAASGTVLDAENCTVSKVARTTNGLAFTRLDRGLPLNLGILSGLQYRWVPVPEGINRYMLTVANLPAGDYELRVEGRSLGKISAGKLARGLNIASATADGWEPGGPWDAQSDIVKELVDARDKHWMGAVMREKFNRNHPQHAKLAKQSRDVEDRLIAQQRAQAKPYPYRFEIRRVP